MQALHDVVKAGYVRYIGMSSCYAWQCELLFSLDRCHADAFYERSCRNAEYNIFRLANTDEGSY